MANGESKCEDRNVSREHCIGKLKLGNGTQNRKMTIGVLHDKKSEVFQELREYAIVHGRVIKNAQKTRKTLNYDEKVNSQLRSILTISKHLNM